MSAQLTDRVMMVRPGLFGSNRDTLGDNAFQSDHPPVSSHEVHASALGEFDAFAKLVEKEGVRVDIVEDTTKGPDAVFPNNWISFHGPPGDGEDELGKAKKPSIVLYPMMSQARRKERRSDIVEKWRLELGAQVVDYTKYENDDMFLEGTGSMVLDRMNRIVYACLSQRTSKDLLQHFCNDFNFELVTFRAFSTLGGSSIPIYHTNVMMSIGTTFAMVCVDSITDREQREQVCERLVRSGKTIISISVEQMMDYAGNVLQLRSTRGHGVLAMSTRGYNSLTEEQLQTISEHSCSIVHGDLSTLEKFGGGGARCMIAEVFPPIL